MKNKMKKIKELWNRLNKRNALIGLLIIVIIIILIAVICGLGGTKTITCTKNNTVVDFKFKEELVIKLKKEKITSIKLDKSVTIGDDYNKFDTYHNIIHNLFTNSYEYLDKSDYKIKQKGNTTTVNLLIDKDKKGVILDNMQIVSNNPDNKYDLTFNRVNNLESASTTYKVGDEYKVKELKLKIEGLGYTCK